MNDQPAPEPKTSPEPPTPDEITESDGTYEAASRSTAEFVQSVQPLQAQKQKRRRGRIIWVIVLLLLLGGGGAGYFFLLKPKDKPPETNPPVTNEQQSTESQETANLSEHYVSQDLRLALDHPSNWKRDDATTGQLKLESPMTKLTDGSGEQTDAKVLITILSGGSAPPGFTGNTGLAVMQSEKVAYAAPGPSQRKETHLSFLGLGSGQELSAIYITGDSGYQKDQTIPKTDVAKIEPIIGITFLKCNGSTCTEHLAIQPDAWQASGTLKTAKAILQSLAIQ